MKVSEFKKIIKETVREVLKEELAGKVVLTEQYSYPQTTIVQPKNTPYINPDTPNSLQSLLEETRRGMSGEDFTTVMNMDSSNVNRGFNPNMMGYGNNGSAPVVSTVEAMVNASNNGATTEEQVQITAVPDFSGLMGRLKEGGHI